MEETFKKLSELIGKGGKIKRVKNQLNAKKKNSF
jgi:hypothetical protein